MACDSQLSLMPCSSTSWQTAHRACVEYRRRVKGGEGESNTGEKNNKKREKREEDKTGEEVMGEDRGCEKRGGNVSLVGLHLLALLLNV